MLGSWVRVQSLHNCDVIKLAKQNDPDDFQWRKV